MSTAENIVNDLHKSDSANLLAAFERFMEQQRKENPCIILDYYVVADYCLEQENKRSHRSDVLSIQSVPKVRG